MAFHLGPDARAAGFRLDSHDTVGSTNAEALAAAAAGDPGRLWVAASAQTAGVGRRGRKWHTPAGNLAATVFTITDVTPTKAATLGFVAGLALDQALHSVAPALPVAMAMDGGEGDRCVRFALKWPNDVLADGAKIAGILLQTVPVPGDRLGVIVGMGINVVTAPPGLDRAATSLRELGCAVSAEALFAELTDAWVGFERLWDDGRGLGVVRELWLERASGVGEAVAVRGERGVIRGVFETIDPEGRLVVRAPDGALLHVTAGEVHFGIAATAGPAV